MTMKRRKMTKDVCRTPALPRVCMHTCGSAMNTQPEQSSSCSSAVGAGGRDGKEETFLGHQGQGAWTSGFSMTIFTHPMIRNRHASRVFVQFEQQKGALGAALPPALSHLSAKMALPSGGSSVRSHPRAHTHTHMGCLSYKAIPRGS